MPLRRSRRNLQVDTGLVRPQRLRWEHWWRTAVYTAAHQILGFVTGLSVVLVVWALGALAVVLETEYRRLSHDLHGGVGHALSGISSHAAAGSWLLRRDPDVASSPSPRSNHSPGERSASWIRCWHCCATTDRRDNPNRGSTSSKSSSKSTASQVCS
jgi:hypothetical protein